MRQTRSEIEVQRVLGDGSPEEGSLSNHDPYELLGRPQVALLFIMVPSLYPFAASEIMLEEVLRCFIAFFRILEDARRAADVGLKLGFQHFAQLRSRTEPGLVMAIVRVVRWFHD